MSRAAQQGLYIYIYIYIYTPVCKHFEPLIYIYISIYIYGVYCGKVLVKKKHSWAEKNNQHVATGRYSCSIYWRYCMFIQISLPGNKFSSGTLPTMHWIFLYTDIYIKGSIFFANSCIYIYIYWCVHGSDNWLTGYVTRVRPRNVVFLHLLCFFPLQHEIFRNQWIPLNSVSEVSMRGQGRKRLQATKKWSRTDSIHNNCKLVCKIV